MSKNAKKVPAAVIIIVAVIVAVMIFVPTVYMPYKNKKPTMDAEHEEVLAQLKEYDDAIADQDNIEADIEKLQAEWDQYQKDMFVNASSSLDDLQKVVDKLGITLLTFDRGSETEDPSGAYSFTGSPLYYVTIKMTMNTDEETLLELLKYIEQDSVGCYYVRNLSAATYSEDKEEEGTTIKEGDLSVNMEVNLYYYNQKITIDPSLLETDTDTDTEAES